jgi:hypothetical protein
MAENKMEQVAALFGKKLNEGFVVRNTFDGHRKCMFTSEGLEVEDGRGNGYINHTWLAYLLIGKACEEK